MLQAIENAGLTNITVVGSRYFGGVKLGIGGLIRAYRACAEAGLQEARRVTEVFFAPYRVIISYGQLGTVLREAAAFGKVDDVQYGAEQVTVCCSIPLSVSAPFKKQLLDVTGGKAEVEKVK
jgi:putative IMPACT (imprinted ancient) family translation regulator